MNDLSPETNRLLELARDTGGLTDERRAQLKAGLLTQIAAIGLVGATSAGAGATVVAGAGVAGAGAAGASATVGKVAWLSSSVLKAISALTLISVTGAGLYAVSRAPHAAEPPPSSGTSATTGKAVAPSPALAAAPPLRAPELTPVEATPASPTANANEKPAAPARVSNAAPPPAPVTAETLADETRLLRDADQALRAGNARRALSLLDEHASRYPRGVLTPERNAERMIARCKLGQIEPKSAEAYLGSHPNSAFLPRIRDACNLTAR